MSSYSSSFNELVFIAFNNFLYNAVPIVAYKCCCWACYLRTVRLVRRGAEDMGPAGNNSRNKGKNRDELELPEDQWFYEIQTISRLIAEGKKEVFLRNMEVSRNVMEVLEKARKSAGMSF